MRGPYPIGSDGSSAWQLADRDRRGVAAGLLGRRRQLAEGGVADVVGVDGEGGGVRCVEAFHQVLGGERAATTRAGFDARGLVHLVTEGGHLRAPGGGDV